MDGKKKKGSVCIYCIQYKKRLHCSIYFRPQEVPGGEKILQIVKDSVGNYLTRWHASKSQLFIPVCDPE